MGLVFSVVCSFLFCLERSMTWILCCVFLLVIMIIAFVLGMYGITIGYHMAQKRMSARMEQRHVIDDTNYEKYIVTTPKSLRRVMEPHARRLDNIRVHVSGPSYVPEGSKDDGETERFERITSSMPVLGYEMGPIKRRLEAFPKARLHVRDVTSTQSELKYLVQKQAELIVRRMLEYETSKTTILYRKFPTAFQKAH